MGICSIILISQIDGHKLEIMIYKSQHFTVVNSNFFNVCKLGLMIIYDYKLEHTSVSKFNCDISDTGIVFCIHVLVFGSGLV